MSLVLLRQWHLSWRYNYSRHIRCDHHSSSYFYGRFCLFIIIIWISRVGVLSVGLCCGCIWWWCYAVYSISISKSLLLNHGASLQISQITLYNAHIILSAFPHPLFPRHSCLRFCLHWWFVFGVGSGDEGISGFYWGYWILICWGGLVDV